MNQNLRMHTQCQAEYDMCMQNQLLYEDQHRNRHELSNGSNSSSSINNSNSSSSSMNYTDDGSGAVGGGGGGGNGGRDDRMLVAPPIMYMCPTQQQQRDILSSDDEYDRPQKYRYFRVRMTGKNSGGGAERWRYWLTLCGIELYGELFTAVNQDK